MYEVFRQKLQGLLGEAIAQGILSKEKEIYFFGINDSCRETIAFLRAKGMAVAGILENNPARQNTFCSGVRAMPVADGLRGSARNKVYVISSPYWREMKAQLIRGKVPEDNILVLFVFFDDAPWKPYFRTQLRQVFRGRDIYRGLEKMYSPRHKFLLCPYTGTGDIYLIGTLLPQYVAMHGIKKYVLLVVSASCKKVARIFDIPSVFRLERMEDCTDLIRYYMLCPDECNMEILNDSWADVYTNPTQWVRGLHGMNFTQMFTRFVFRLGEDARPQQPAWQEKSEEVDAVFARYGMPPKRTVVLAPYTTTLSELSDAFWESLAAKLSGRGYAVYTNSSGESEPAIRGTQPVFFPLEIAPQVIARAGGFISVRSGLCDVISAAKAKKIILYDKFSYFYNCKAYDYFSLEKMGLCEDAVELQYDNHDEQAIERMIMREFGRVPAERMVKRRDAAGRAGKE